MYYVVIFNPGTTQVAVGKIIDPVAGTAEFATRLDANIYANKLNCAQSRRLRDAPRYGVTRGKQDVRLSKRGAS